LALVTSEGMKRYWANRRRREEASSVDGPTDAAVGSDPAWRPWKHSTGPKSEEGKARVSRNAYKGGTRAILRELARLLREQV
jgi:hypothetical protein